jgi:endo-1,4-beta-mannosidase
MVRFSLGINYWPRRSAMAMWQRFDAGEIAEDFARIAALGLDTVRFFLRWSDFQPQPGALDATMLARLEALADLAARAGLRTMPTLFCGHMSGVNWLPAWSIPHADRAR